MKSQDIPEPLRTFLKEKGLVKKYLNNCRNHNYSKGGAKRAWIKFKNYPNIIDHSFIWALTEEGQDFWGKIDLEYKNYLENGK